VNNTLDRIADKEVVTNFDSLISPVVMPVIKEFSVIDLSKLSIINAKVMGMLLPTVQAHLRLSSLTEFSLKHLSLIVLFL